MSFDYSLILDILIIVFLIWSFLTGYKKGLLNRIFWLAGGLFSLFVIAKFSSPIENYVYTTFKIEELVATYLPTKTSWGAILRTVATVYIYRILFFILAFYIMKVFLKIVFYFLKEFVNTFEISEKVARRNKMLGGIIELAVNVVTIGILSIFICNPTVPGSMELVNSSRVGNIIYRATDNTLNFLERTGVMKDRNLIMADSMGISPTEADMFANSIYRISIYYSKPEDYLSFIRNINSSNQDNINDIMYDVTEDIVMIGTFAIKGLVHKDLTPDFINLIKPIVDAIPESIHEIQLNENLFKQLKTVQKSMSLSYDNFSNFFTNYYEKISTLI